METAAECYAMAEKCMRQASQVQNERMRNLLLEAAAQWRAIAAEMEAEEAANRGLPGR